MARTNDVAEAATRSLLMPMVSYAHRRVPNSTIHNSSMYVNSLVFPPGLKPSGRASKEMAGAFAPAIAPPGLEPGAASYDRSKRYASPGTAVTILASRRTKYERLGAPGRL